MDEPATVIFDGDCAGCTAGMTFVRAHARPGRLVYAARDSPAALLALRRAQVHGEAPPSLLLVVGDRVFARSDAALRIARSLRRPWCWLYGFSLVPRSLRDAAYEVVARRRYRWFGHATGRPTRV